MSRKSRLNISGYWYHICCRGQRKQPLFFSHQDRIKYLEFLNKSLLSFDCSLGAFVLMTNHIHLLLKMGRYPFGKVFQSTNTKYAVYFNLLRKTTGHVFQDRPTIKIILKDSYLNNVVNYIYENPVRAKIVKNKYQYRWSSIQVDSNSYFEKIYLKSWKKIDFNKNATKYNYCEDYIGSKKEYIKLEKRFSNKKTYFIQKRNKTAIKELLDEALLKHSTTFEQLVGFSRNPIITTKRKKIMIDLYNKGINASEIARLFKRTPTVIYNAIKGK